MATQNYTVLEPLEHDGKRYKIGQPITLDERTAAELRPLKVIGPAGAEPWPEVPLAFTLPTPSDPMPLPDDFPGRAALVLAGRTTFESLAGLVVENLTAIKSIGESTAQAIIAARDARQA